MLKAFFDESAELIIDDDGKHRAVPAGSSYKPMAYVPDGNALKEALVSQPLTVGGELNKLAANISIGRNMAGVHYYSDYTDSMRMGEAIAVGILQEQALTYPRDRFTVGFTTFDGKPCLITNDQVNEKGRVTVEYA